jgi:16S rRNA G966 N2-methylase RsmD
MSHASPETFEQRTPAVASSDLLDAIVCGDCMEVLPSLPDKSVDVVITDPPYLTTDLHFDASLSMQWVEQLLRVVKPDGYLACFCPVEMAAQISVTWKLRFTGAWVKSSPNMRTATAKKPRNQWELYCVFAHPKHRISNLVWNNVMVTGTRYQKAPRINTGYRRGGKDQLDRADASGWTANGHQSPPTETRYQTDVIIAPPKCSMPHDERSEHPTQKPLDVISTLVQWLTNPGDVILDPFAGSATTCVAAKQLNRRFIGIEKESQYVQIGNKRLEQSAMPLGV